MKAPKEGLTLAGAVMAALIASACCIGPLLFALLGLGGAASALALEPYRPWLIGATVLLLAAGFYLVYRRPRPEPCAADAACSSPARRGRWKLLLWVATLLALVALAFPYYVGYLL